MKKLALFLFAGIVSSSVIARDDCREPAENWQPKERLEQLMNESKWQVQRIKVDDGCYEVDGTDPQGNEIEAKFSPASLKLKKFEVKFKEDKNDGPAFYGQLKDIAYFKK
jgi:hypothetical protein